VTGCGDAGELLRHDLLVGRSIVLAGPPAPVAGALGPAVAAACTALGARVSRLVPDPVDEDATASAVADCVSSMPGPGVLVSDGAGLLAHGLAEDGDDITALRACVDAVWNATRAVATAAFLPPGGGGRIISLAPTRHGGPPAEAARAALENMSRTLSIEWARHGVTAVSIAPGAHDAERDVAALVAFLASPAGDYYSGCQLDLRGA
jgi:NAD(P)-dependent dehydrogenase (short-subunit alcohol dehydrogenase family)